MKLRPFPFCLALALAWLGPPQTLKAQGSSPVSLRTTDYLVPHVSTVPANAGKFVELFVREKVKSKRARNAPVVLLLAGATVSAIPAFDVQFENYSWMEHLATAGFDVFTMDFTGYGLSPRPMMDNPCNISTAQQQQYLMPGTPLQPCVPAYPYQLTSIKTDWDEIDRVVDYITNLRGVDKVHIAGWSRGGVRAAGYAGLHPEKVDRLFLYAPGDNVVGGNYSRNATDDPPQKLPLAGTPTNILGANDFHVGWDGQVGCVDEFSSGIRPVITQTMLDFDPLGSTWGTAGVRRAPNFNATSPNWGLSTALVAKIKVPTLVIIGDLDKTVVVPSAQALFADLTGVPQKVYVHVACAAHQLIWENQHMVLLDASVEWLRRGTYQSRFNGSFAVDAAGNVRQEP